MFSYLHTHVGRGADQLPLLKHSLWDSPINLYPSLHVWLTIDPKVVDSALISDGPTVTIVPVVLPFTGVPGSPQSTTGIR